MEVMALGISPWTAALGFTGDSPWSFAGDSACVQACIVFLPGHIQLLPNTPEPEVQSCIA